MVDMILKLLYKLLEFLNEYSDDKILHSFETSGIEILSDEGWSKMTHIHETKPFDVYTLILENGMSIDCADNHIVFCKDNVEKYVKDLSEDDSVITQYGLYKVISVTKKQNKLNMVDCTVDNTKHSYYSNGILSHNTTTSAIFLLHYILFNTDKNSLVLGNKRKTAVEILDKIRKIFYEIPHFLKPGVLKWNESEIAFDNGCRCMAEATTINSGISFTFHCVLADEFAHIPPNILDKFYNNLFPTITAGKARFIISSTQNGFNLFQKLYIAAENGENDYGAFRTDWWEVPEWNPDTHTWDKRDDEWKRRQVANYGSEEAFEAQFGTRFMVNCSSLIENRVLNERLSESVKFVNKYLLGVLNSEYFHWLPDYEPNEELIRENLLITIDIGEGLKRDYTVFVISRVYPNGKIKALGYFKSNTIRVETCALILCRLISSHINQNRCLISFEVNTYGQLFFKCIRDISEQYSSLEHGSDIDYNMFIRYDNENAKIPGIKLTSKNKPVFCSLFKQEFENGDIEFSSSEFLREVENFVDIKDNGSYSAIVGHDDIVMAAIQISAARQTDKFKYFLQEISSNEMSDEPFVDLYNFRNYDMDLSRWRTM